MLKQRMYHFVLYNISPIQQGIQAYHSGIEYSLKHGYTEEYKQWANNDKTVIILNGGTSNRTGHTEYNEPFTVPNSFGTMEKIKNDFIDNNVAFASFYEPDLNNATTAIAFLVDERVWDKELYPIAPKKLDFANYENFFGPDSFEKNSMPEDFESVYTIWKTSETRYLGKKERYEVEKKVYGENIAFLRNYLSNFKLA